MKIYDISQEVFSCQVYPGDPVPEKQVLESIENDDPTKRRVVEMLDNLCYADVVGGEYADIAVASCPMLCGTQKRSRAIKFPTESVGYDANIKKAHNTLIKMPLFRRNVEVFRFYLNPPRDILHIFFSKAGENIRKRFVAFHQYAKISYQKNTMSQYVSVPDVDMLIGIDNFNISSLMKFREAVQHDIESAQSSIREISSMGSSIIDKLSKSKRGPIRNFWGEEMDLTQTQSTQKVDNSLKYTYNEGFTNAVRRKVPFHRIVDL